MSSSPTDQIRYSYKGDEIILRHDLSDIHPSLGDLVQRFVRSDEEYGYFDNRSYWESIFQIFSPDGTKTMNARELDKADREKIWERVFLLKDTFLRDEQPDVVILRVKHPFPPERRIERYREHYAGLPEYDFYPNGKTMYLERK